MPNIKSAIKRVLIAERNRLRNKSVKSAIKTAIRNLKDEIAQNKNSENVEALLNKCKAVIDQAVSKGVYHKNTASRKKSRLELFVNKARQAEETPPKK